MDKDFFIGMKVSLDNEFGVVIKSESDNQNIHGVIRWDTPNENDLEDWRGLFGTFISSGGEIINSDYTFKFITDEGNLKNN